MVGPLDSVVATVKGLSRSKRWAIETGAGPAESVPAPGFYLVTQQSQRDAQQSSSRVPSSASLYEDRGQRHLGISSPLRDASSLTFFLTIQNATFDEESLDCRNVHSSSDKLMVKPNKPGKQALKPDAKPSKLLAA